MEWPPDEWLRVVVDEAAALPYLAEHACVTPRVSLSREARAHAPDRVVFDLDPYDGSRAALEMVCHTARLLREVLRESGLVAFVTTSGARGLHVHVPILAELAFDVVATLAHRIAGEVTARDPGRATTDPTAARSRTLIDFMSNAYAMTVVAPYGVRALPGAPVATPLRWDEVDPPVRVPRSSTMTTVFERLSEIGDPWAEIGRHARSLVRANPGIDDKTGDGPERRGPVRPARGSAR